MRHFCLVGLLVVLACGGTAAAVGEAAITMSAETRPDGVELHLDGASRMPVAVFQRASVLWVIVGGGDGEVAGWPGLARRELASWLTPIASEPATRARLLRFALPRPASVDVVPGATGWRIRVGPPGPDPRPAAPGDPFARSVERGTLEAAADGQLLDVADPATGERLGALLSARNGLRQAAPARLVDLELLSSGQGLVWRPLADGVTATLDAGRLTLLRPGGLRLSHDTAPAALTDDRQNDDAPITATAAAVALPSQTIGLGTLGPTDAATRQRSRLDLLAGMRDLAGPPRAVARLQLAKLYLADALGPEARTALELIDPADLAEPAAHRLRMSRAAVTGAVAAVTGQTDRALTTLLEHRLDQDQEVALWRAYAAARATRWKLAEQEWARTGTLLDGYPMPLRRLLGFELASALVEDGDADAALSLIDRLRPLPLPVDQRARLSLIEGLGLARAGQAARAERALDTALAQGDRATRVQAAFLLTSLRQEWGDLSADEAAAQLGAQRAGWPGHRWEARMLRRLGDLEAAAGQPVAALGSWQAARERAADTTTAAAIGDEQRVRLRAMLAATGRDALPPVAALALYRTYHQLLDGEAGDDALRLDLAARAAENGLLETAAALLDRRQPRQPAAGYDEARLALAEAVAATGDSAGALARLNTSIGGKAAMPPAETRLRAQLRAEAAVRVGDDRAALVAIAGAQDAAAARLRWAAMRRQGDWDGLARAAAAVLPPAGDPGQTGALSTEAATWLALCRDALGQPGVAAGRTQDRASGSGAEPTEPLLRLVMLTAPASMQAAELPAAIGAYAGDVRRVLDQLPDLPARGGAPIKSASERSAPAG